MDFSIIIPVYNKANLTKQCLDALLPSIADAGDGEVIVVDNASSDSTQQLLEKYPWVNVIRNEKNGGFARANNQGAAIAQGDFLVLLNNDTVPHPGWLKAMLKSVRQENVGIVGARLLFPDQSIQHAGVVLSSLPMARIDFAPIHFAYRTQKDSPLVTRRRSMQAVTAACLVVTKDNYQRVRGLDEEFWNGYEDVDFCLKIGALGLEIIYEPSAIITHFESQSGAHRFRQANWNTELLARRWNGKLLRDDIATYLQDGQLTRPVRQSRGAYAARTSPIPSVTLLVHNAGTKTKKELRRQIPTSAIDIENLFVLSDHDWYGEIARNLEMRGSRYVVLLDADAQLEKTWLDKLIAQLEWSDGIGAAAASPHLRVGRDVVATLVGARCTVLAMDRFPQHHRPRVFPTLDGSIADFLMRATEFGLTVRGVERSIGQIPPQQADPQLHSLYGLTGKENLEKSESEIEATFAVMLPSDPKPALVSIVTLSWNALAYTKIAIDSIRKNTTVPYEIIVVDNGSDDATVGWLREQHDLRVIYNPSNRGFAAGNNQGIAAARGEYIIVLNNDVYVPQGWVQGLLAPFGRVPGLGMTAPRSNRVAGSQQLDLVNYADLAQFEAFAEETRNRFAGTGWVTDRAIGFCLCIDRRVIDEVGGFDEEYGVGNFEDDDFSLRVRSAGYKILVCDDVVIHHYGSQTFAANNIDYSATMRKNWSRFATKWGLPAAYPTAGYVATDAISRGFDRSKHYAPLTKREFRFLAYVRNDADWETVAAFIKRFARAYSSSDPVVLDIVALDDADPEVIASRIERLLERHWLHASDVANIEIGYETSLEPWLARLDLRSTWRIEQEFRQELHAVPQVPGTTRKALRDLLEMELTP